GGASLLSAEAHPRSPSPSLERHPAQVYVGNLSRERSHVGETGEEMAVRLSRSLEQLFHVSQLSSIAVSLRGHAFVTFCSEEEAERACRTPCFLDGRALKIEPRGGSPLHQLRSHLSTQLPSLQLSSEQAYWELPLSSGGGLVAVSRNGGLKATKEALAAQTLRFLRRKSEEGERQEEKPTLTKTEPQKGEEEEPSTMEREPSEKEPSEEPSEKEPSEKEPSEEPSEKEPSETEPSEDEVGNEEQEVSGAGPICTTSSPRLPAPPVGGDGPGSVRNICIIAHVDHGKTTLADCLLCAAGQLSSARSGEACSLDRGLEAERGITIYSSAVTLAFPTLTLNLVDCPGHAEFNSEVSAALRLCDGAALLVDVKEGVMAQSEAVLRQALADGVRVILVLNKMDKLLPDTFPREGSERKPLDQQALLAAYEQMRLVISQVNGIIESHNAAASCRLRLPTVSLEEGSVLFGSGRLGWLASFDSIARLYAAKAVQASKPNLDPSPPPAEAEGVGDLPTEREVFELAHARAVKAMSGGRAARLLLAPIAELHALAGERASGELEAKLSKLCPGARLSKPSAVVTAKALRKEVFARLLPAASELLAAVVAKLPSPQQAQRLRAPLLSPSPTEEWEGGEEKAQARASASSAASAAAISACDPCAGLLLYVAKMVPLPASKAHAALCRVFSGTVRPGAEVWVLPTSTCKRPLKARISRVLRLDANSPPAAISEGRAGSVCALVGLDKAMSRGGTVSDQPGLAALAAMKLSVALVERRALLAPAGLASRRLAEAIPALTRGDPLVVCEWDEQTGEQVLCGSGELHLDACVHRLRELMGAEGSSLRVAPAAVAHRETVSTSTPRDDTRPGTLGKSANRHNRLWFVASPLSSDLCAEMESESFKAASPAERARLLVAAHGWEGKHARRILCYGPGGHGPNVLVDATIGVQGMDGVAEHLLAAFEQLCIEGPLCAERLRGVRLDVTDAKIHSEPAQRRAAQVVPAARRGMAAAVLAASPKLLEPMHVVRLKAPLASLADVYDELEVRRGEGLMHDQEGEANGCDAREALCTLRGAIPLSESAGLTEELRSRLHGKASGLSLAFSHWRPLQGSPWTAEAGEASSGSMVSKIRLRKKIMGLPPTAEVVGDKL
ncbi:MAG: hypothetical protein SGPRY_006124, partial [Prymnesium sp.]